MIKAQHLTWKRDQNDMRDHKFDLPLHPPQELPPTFDIEFTFPVYDQGEIGSCTANALAAAIEFDKLKNSNEQFVPSRLFIYYNERVIEGDVVTDSGAALRDGIKSLNIQGVCTETLWPYSDTGPLLEGGAFPPGSKPVTKPTAEAYAEAATNKIVKYQRLNQDVHSLQSCLVHDYPFVFGIQVFESWFNNEVVPTTIPMPTQNDINVGGHAIIAVGYDSPKQVFKFRNSWGPNVGENGYFYIPFHYISNSELASDFWVIFS